jgi:hypothetical protein
MSIEGVGCFDGYDEYEKYGWSTYGGSVGASASGSTDSNGNTTASTEGHITHETEKSGRITGRVEIEIEKKSDGQLFKKAKARVDWEKNFNSFAIKV